MADETKTASRKPRRWLRWIGILFAVFLLVLVVAYFVGTSEWMLKSVILPRVSKAMNADVTVESASISPFSAVTLGGLKVQTKGPDPLVTSKQVRLRYSLIDIIKGNINVSEVALESPTVNLVTFPDGTSNLDPITKRPQEAEPREKKQPSGKEHKPTQLNLQKFALNNATVRKVDQRKDGTQQVLQLSGVNVTAADLANDKTGKLTLAADVSLNQGLSGASNGVITAKVAGNFDLALDAELKPAIAKGQTKIDVAQAQGPFAQANGLGVVLNSDVTPKQLNDVSVRFTQSGKNLGAITARGPFSPETMEGKIAVAISGIDKQLLNLIGGPMGVDFNQTTISSTNTIELAQRGRTVSVNGALLVGNFGVTQKGQSTPAMDIRSGYAVTLDQTNQTALVQTFTLNGTQGGNEFLRGTLAKPMLLELGKSSGAVDESAFNLVVTNFNLPDWQAFIGTNATVSNGKLAVTLSLVSKQAGKNLSLNLATRLTQLSAVAGSNRIDNADIVLDAKGTVQDFSAVKLDSYSLQLARGGQKAVTAAGALAYNTKTQDADVQTDLDVALPQVTALVVVPGLNLQAGAVKFTGRVVQKNTTPTQTNSPVLDRSVVGKLNVTELTGAFQSNRFDRFAAAMDLDVAMRGDAVTITKCSGSLQQSGQPGGSFDVAGNYNLATKGGQIAAKLVDLNQHALKSFVAGALGEKQLETITINASANANLASATDGTVKAELHLANLVVNDPSGTVPRTPLAVDLSAEAAMAKQVFDIKSIQLALTKTERAPNTLNVVGHFDLSKSNAWTGNAKVTSDGLDLTTYYDLFAKKSTNTTATAEAKPGAPVATGEAKPETEPQPIKLPFAQFTEEVSIAKLFLREIAISNLAMKTTIDNGRVNLNPFSMSLNGAPVNVTAALNLAVAGFQYDLNAKMDRVPVEPLANTFAPEKKGQFKGDLIANAAIKGAGVTGKGFKNNLGGNVGLTLTNANVQVTQNKWIQRLLAPLSVALGTPELAQSPLTWIDSQVGIGSGTVTLTNALVRSSFFEAGVRNGTITLNDVLTNSTFNNMPVQIAVVGSVAERLKFLAQGGTATNYVLLPQFYVIGGTLGNPDPHIDKAALLKGAAAEVISRVGGDAGKILRGIGGNLGLGGATNAPTGTTNAAPATNSGAGGLLQALPGLFDKQPKAPRTNAPARRR